MEYPFSASLLLVQATALVKYSPIYSVGPMATKVLVWAPSASTGNILEVHTWRMSLNADALQIRSPELNVTQPSLDSTGELLDRLRRLLHRRCGHLLFQRVERK